MAVWETRREAYGSGVAWLLELAGAVGDRWDAPGLGEWDVRALVGHAGRSLLTVEEYLARPAAEAVVPDAAAYYRAVRAAAAGAGVAARGVAAGARLGEDPVATLRADADRVRSALAVCTGREIVTTLAGGMVLEEYLATRAVELAVHGCDLAVALSLPAAVPRGCASVALGVLAELAADDGAPALLALTGRAGLPAGYSVL